MADEEEEREEEEISMIEEHSQKPGINNYNQHETQHIRVLPHHPEHSIKSNSRSPERPYPAQLQNQKLWQLPLVQQV